MHRFTPVENLTHGRNVILEDNIMFTFHTDLHVILLLQKTVLN